MDAEPLLRALLSPANAERAAAERRYAETPPAVRVAALLDVLRRSGDAVARLTAGTLLRRLLQRESWETLGDMVREGLKPQLLQLLAATAGERAVHAAVAHCVAALAGREVPLGRWPELLPLLLGALQSGPPPLQGSALAVLGELLRVAGLDQLGGPPRPIVEAVAAAVSRQDLSLRVAALEVGATIAALSDEHEGLFRVAVPHCLEAVAMAMQNADYQLAARALEAVTDLASEWPQLFAAAPPAADLALQCITAAAAPDDVRCLAVELFLTLLEVPGACRAPAVLGRFFAVLLELLATFPESQSWSAADDGDAGHDAPAFDVAFEAVERMAAAVGERGMEPVAPPLVLAWISRPEWSAKSAALLALSQLCVVGGGQMEQRVGYLMGLALQCLGNSHPQVRYAAIQCIAQLATHFPTAFSSSNVADGMTALLRSLADEAPRVAAHAALALVNFFEDLPAEAHQPYVSPAITALLQRLGTDTQPAVHANHLAALAAVARAHGPHLGPLYRGVMDTTLAVLRRPARQRAERLRRSRAILCVAHVAVAVGPETFRPDSEAVMRLLLDTPLVEGDPQTATLHLTLPMLATAIGDPFCQYLPSIVPSLLRHLSADCSPQAEAGSSSPSQAAPLFGAEETINVDVAQLAERASAAAALSELMAQFPGALLPHGVALLAAAVPLLRHPHSPPLRRSCAALLASVVCAAWPSGASEDAALPQAFQALLQATRAEDVPKVQAAQIAALGRVAEAVPEGGLPRAALGQWATVLGEALQGALRRVAAREAEEDEEEEDDAGGEGGGAEATEDGEEEAVRGTLEEDTKLLQEIRETTTALLERHAAFRAAFNAALVHPLCLLLHAPSPASCAMALHLLTAFMRTAEPELFQPYGPDFITALKHFAGHDDPEVVGAAAAGLRVSLLAPEWRTFAVQAFQAALPAISTALDTPECLTQSAGWEFALCDVVLLLLSALEVVPEAGAEVWPRLLRLLPVGGDLRQCREINAAVVGLYAAGHPAVAGWPQFVEYAAVLRENPLMVHEATLNRLHAIAAATT